MLDGLGALIERQALKLRRRSLKRWRKRLGIGVDAGEALETPDLREQRFLFQLAARDEHEAQMAERFHLAMLRLAAVEARLDALEKERENRS